MKVSLVENRDELATATNPEKRPEMVRKLHRLICSCKGDVDNCEAAKITAPPEVPA